jgi:hypothetical protein
MPTVVPSQIVEFIDATMSEFMAASSQGIQMNPGNCGVMNALLRLIEQLPNALVPLDSQIYAQFVLSQESIRFAVEKAQNQDVHQDLHLLHSLMPDGNHGKTQVRIIREALAACPDEIAPQASKELPFIKDATIRTVLLIDLEAVRSALIHGEWKAATVLAGALVEALLLWAIKQKSNADVQKACSDALTAGRLQKSPPPDPLNWVLHDFVEVAQELKLITVDAAKEARLAKDYRNLIHPGRSIRLQQICDRGTALMTSAAVEHVVRDLGARFP